MARLNWMLRMLCLVMLPALLAQGARAAEPPQFGARIGAGADITLSPLYWVLIKESGSVAATMRYRTTAHWDFETELGVGSGGLRFFLSRKNAFTETFVSVKVPLMGRYWRDESRTGFYMSAGVQLHFIIWGEGKENKGSDLDDSFRTEIYRLTPIWTPSRYRRWKRDGENDANSHYTVPVTVSIPFRVGWKFRKVPLDVAFTTHQLLYYPHTSWVPYFPVHVGASCTWWF